MADRPVIAALRRWLGDRLTTDAEALARHGRDESSYPITPPEAVCYPMSTDEVVQIVNACRDYRTPIIPFGMGSSVEGGVLAVQGGVCADLTRMNQILRVNRDDLDCTVQAGLTRQQLNNHLQGLGIFFPVDPGANATLGGMVATRASGTNAMRYGTMRDNVLALTVVLANGEVIQTASRARKSSAGYDLTRLFVGSEGTLGIITEVTLRLHPLPEVISAAVVSFARLEQAVQAVIQTVQLAAPVARIELLDEVMMKAINQRSGLPYPVQPTLFLEFEGTAASARESIEQTGQVMAACGGSDFQWATETDQRQKLWRARHHAYFAALAQRPGCRAVATDVCVPMSRLADCILETKQDLAQTSLIAPLVGHVGDGNFHLIILVDPNNPAELAEVQRINERLIMRALAMEGTCTGEHGIGLGKRKFMEAEHGAALGVMRAIKQALDPLNLLNPGKVLPE
ncbi:MAG: FAD-binding protein [Candidatus Tectomicrobia bacterium]|uniref:D-lactate dehydrogenase (cytochrome) n=1 Tax=Tectimicrobiota bacterium TaxID=2528274 RepID=A0A932FXI8_UNCTE|nr:FAD-binding protein [Candidatus Tectomicrobia bacterium]